MIRWGQRRVPSDLPTCSLESPMSSMRRRNRIRTCGFPRVPHAASYLPRAHEDWVFHFHWQYRCRKLFQRTRTCGPPRVLHVATSCRGVTGLPVFKGRTGATLPHKSRGPVLGALQGLGHWPTARASGPPGALITPRATMATQAGSWMASMPIPSDAWVAIPRASCAGAPQ